MRNPLAYVGYYAQTILELFRKVITTSQRKQYQYLVISFKEKVLQVRK